jgi:hypothetical protein
MTTAALEKRVRALEKEIKHLRHVVREQPYIPATPTARGIAPKKRLPVGLRQALKEVREGKISGPFNTVDELMAHLEK